VRQSDAKRLHREVLTGFWKPQPTFTLEGVKPFKAGLTIDTMMSVLRTTMAWNNQLAIGMPKRPLAGDFAPGFMMKLAQKDCRLALQMVDGLGVVAPVGHATLAALNEGIRYGLQDMDVGSMLKMREEQAGVTVRLPKP